MLKFPTSLDHARELEFLVCLSLPSLSEPRLERARSICESGLDWDYLLSAAAFHGVVPAFVKHVKAHFGSVVPAKVLEQFNIRIKQITTQNLALVGTFLRFYSELEKQGVRSATFKGPALALLAYKDLFMREFGDVDLVVDRNDVKATQKLLITLGYKPLPERDPPLSESFIQSERFLKATTEHTFARTSPTGVIDVHWEVQPSHLLPVTSNQVLSSSVHISLEGRSIRTLEPNLLFVVLAAHASKHAWDRFVWIVDIVQLLDNCPDLDFQKIYSIADSLHVDNMVTLALLLTNRFFDMAMPPLASSRVNGNLERLAEEVLLNLPAMKLEGEGHLLRYCQFSASLISGFSGKVRFLLREFFQPTVPDLLRQRLPEGLFFAYFALHPLWLFSDAACRRMSWLTPRSRYDGERSELS